MAAINTRDKGRGDSSSPIEERRFFKPLNSGYLIGLIQCYDQPCSYRQHSPQVDTGCTLAILHERAKHCKPGSPVKGADIAWKKIRKRLFDANDLARIVEQNILTPEENMSDLQRSAMKKIREEVYPGLAERNAASLTSDQDMLHLLDQFNVLFFFGALEVQFEWANLPEEQQLGQHVCNSDLIQMSPRFLWRNHTKDDRRRIRTATLLHEATHALFFQFACRHCPTYPISVNIAAYHGRALMTVGTAIGKAYECLVGESIIVAGPECWHANWEHVPHLPSIHDMKEWRWVENQMERDKRHREYHNLRLTAQAEEDQAHPKSEETPTSIDPKLSGSVSWYII